MAESVRPSALIALDIKLRPVLRELNSSSTYIVASAVMTRDGLTISAMLDDRADPDRMGAMASSLLSLSQTASSELQQGKLKQVLIEAEHGYILTVEAGRYAALSVISSKSVNLGMLLIEARRTATAISGHMI